MLSFFLGGFFFFFFSFFFFFFYCFPSQLTIVRLLQFQHGLYIQGTDDTDLESEEEAVWKVDRLLDRRVRGGVEQYLVKWNGCGHDQNSWEPKSNVTQDLIQAFQKKHRK